MKKMNKWLWLVNLSTGVLFITSGIFEYLAYVDTERNGLLIASILLFVAGIASVVTGIIEKGKTKNESLHKAERV
jgi:uncharacterized membrane protein YphA (DoxX/SURF4 family)